MTSKPPIDSSHGDSGVKMFFRDEVTKNVPPIQSELIVVPTRFKIPIKWELARLLAVLNVRSLFNFSDFTHLRLQIL